MVAGRLDVVSPDGQRFLMLKSVEQGEADLTRINVVLNWTEVEAPRANGKMMYATHLI
jgi:hypothetical protein